MIISYYDYLPAPLWTPPRARACGLAGLRACSAEMIWMLSNGANHTVQACFNGLA